jgi:hypothetical protein
MKILFLLGLILFILFYSCAGVKRGTVTKKLNEREAEVYMDENEVKLGDKVEAFFYDCSQRMVAVSHCLRSGLGEGKVIKLLDASSSLVHFNEGTIFKEGTFVDKK